jgi:hypothetical protein
METGFSDLKEEIKNMPKNLAKELRPFLQKD